MGAKKYFLFGLLSVGLGLSIITFPLFYFSGSLLSLIGSEDEIYKSLTAITKLIFPSLIIQALSEIIKTYCNAQGIEKTIGFFNIIITIGLSPLCYYFSISSGMGVMGFILYKYFVDFLNLFFAAFVYRRYCHEKLKGLSFNNYPENGHKEFWNYIKECTRYLFSFYFEGIGLEICTFLVISREDLATVTAFIQFINFVSTVYSIGIGLSILVRTRINFLFGKKKYITAKNFFWFFWKVLISLGLLIGIGGFYTFSRGIASLYTHNEESEKLLGKMLEIYGFIYWSEIAIASSMTSIRSLGRVNYLTIFHLIFTDCLSFTLCVYFGIIKQMGGIGYAIGVSTGICGVGIACFSFLACIDWDLGKKEGKKEDGIELQQSGDFSLRMSVKSSFGDEEEDVIVGV